MSGVSESVSEWVGEWVSEWVSGMMSVAGGQAELCSAEWCGVVSCGGVG